jgi:hypothetical protein
MDYNSTNSTDGDGDDDGDDDDDHDDYHHETSRNAMSQKT